MAEVTQVLSQIEQGDPRAAEQLLPLLYDELRTGQNWLSCGFSPTKRKRQRLNPWALGGGPLIAIGHSPALGCMTNSAEEATGKRISGRKKDETSGALRLKTGH